jgi:hypothetical protein
VKLLGAGGYLAVGDTTSPTETESFKRFAAYAEVASNVVIAMSGVYAIYRFIKHKKTA